MNNLGQFALPCKAASLRGKLKHSYLENAVCLPTLAEDLSDSLTYKENGVARHQLIRQQIREFAELMDNLEQGFSPAQLVDQLRPFRDLTIEQRSVLKSQIGNRFSEDFQLADRKKKLGLAAGEFLEDLDVFLRTPPENANSAQSRMLKVQDSARSVIRELETMPKGIWLWKPVNSERIPS